MAQPPNTLNETEGGSTAAAEAPVGKRVPTETTVWGTKLHDPYRWLQERESEEVYAHLEAENAYTEQMLAPVADLRQQLFDEIKSRIKETDMSVPVVKDGWSYYSRTTEGDEYPLHCRRPATGSPEDLVVAEGPPPADEQVMLNENLEAGDAEFFELGLFDVSPNHRYLLWGSDKTGNEKYRAVVRDLETGEEWDDGLEELSGGSVWALDNATFFYVRPDDTNRPFEVWRHTVGQPADQDVLVYREDDERFFVGVGRDKDDTFIYMGASSKTTDEVRFIPADDPMAEPRVLAERRQDIEYSAAHIDGQFVILTNDGAQNFRVMTTPVAKPEPENWVELIAESPTVTISDTDLSAHFLVLFERTEGTTRIRLRSWADGSFTTVEQPEEVSTTWPGANPDFEATTLRYGYTSMVTPASVFLLETTTGERRLLKQQEVLGDFDSEWYETKREWATASDGTKIPVSLVWRRDTGPQSDGSQSDGSQASDGAELSPRPCVLYAYGAYEVSIDPSFSSARLSLLDRGFCFAIAHVRGGGEMGRQWYLDGKFENKQNTFGDVIAVAEHLIETGWASSDTMVLRGGSAGGLMAGAVVNQAPELFAGVVAHVPFVDALNTILDPTQPLTVTEWEEWGNPAESEEIFQAMLAYSPYENVTEQSYPSIFATGGFNDTRVNYWEPAKWVQRLRHLGTGDGPVLLWTDLAAGHGGPSGRYESWREEARILAYILWIAGLAE